MSADREYLAGIQILRAVAALMVVFNHSLREISAPDWLTTLGAAGVDIFFVISGFIMVLVTFPQGGATETPSSFLFKRFTRIAPLYWLIAAIILLLWCFGLYHHLNPDAEMIFRSFAFLPTEHHIVLVSWTLVFEMYFYVLFAASLFFRSRAASIVLTTAAIASLLFFGRFVPDAETADYLTRPVALEFCFGMALAFCHQRWPRFALFTRWLWLPGFAAMVAAQFLLHPYYVQGWSRVLGWGLPALFIVASMLSMRQARSAAARSAARLGDASYALYLTHPLVMITYAWLLHHLGWFAALPQAPIVALVVVASVALGLLTHRWVELPLLHMTRGLRRFPAPRPT